jgi:hypothetical protein
MNQFASEKKSSLSVFRKFYFNNILKSYAVLDVDGATQNNSKHMVA